MSIAIRSFLWVVAASVVTIVIGTADAILDALLTPWLFGSSPHHMVEGVVFWSVVAPAIWGWISRYVRRIPSHTSHSSEAK